MPAVQPPAKVLVSGANGYIATWVVQTLLQKGYSVRATVRSEAKAAHLIKIFKEYGDKFEFVVVADITEEGAFDEAVKGVDAIEHTASPFHFAVTDPEELIKPAVEGTIGILKSALKHGSSVKRVIVTSSVAAILELDPSEARVFTDKDWNNKSIANVEKQGKSSHPVDMYLASKTLAEKAAWEFVEKNKGKIQWDLTTINPPYVFGPVISDVSSPDGLGTSAGMWYQTLLTPDAGGKSSEELVAAFGSWADVRDVAEAHVLALQKQEAAGERFIVTPREFTWQDWLDVANSLSPSPYPGKTFPKGTPGAGKDAKFLTAYDTSKTEKILDLNYHTKEETTRDTLADFAAKGW